MATLSITLLIKNCKWKRLLLKVEMLTAVLLIALIVTLILLEWSSANDFEVNWL